MGTVELEMSTVVMDVFDSSWVGVDACLCVFLQCVVGPAALPQSAMC